jgi:hypothetical protein
MGRDRVEQGDGMARFVWVFLAFCGLGLMTAATPAAAQQGELTCVCIGKACGNNAIGGDHGDIFDKLTAKTVQDKFYSTGDTGWTCLLPQKTRGSGGPKGCYCGGKPCGNGAVGADPLTVDLGLSQQDVDQKYGGGDTKKTGWLCGNYRGSVS